LEALSLAPREPEKRAWVMELSFDSEESLHTPANVRTTPWPQAVAFASNPIESERAQHSVNETNFILLLNKPKWMIPAGGAETNDSFKAF
jgi:hypothetical protein